MKQRRIGILTSGGDASGMNACIRAVVRAGIFYGMQIVGIERGFAGLLEGAAAHKELGMRSVSDIIHRGGTILKTARSDEFKTKQGQARAYKTLTELRLNALVVIGGDGSFKGARALHKNFGVSAVGIPATIDNDLFYTDYTLGFDTAVNTALYAVNNLRDTMSSHERVCVVEVMGRNSGDIALYTGIAGGAEFVLTPENKIDLKAICDQIAENQNRGKTSNIIVTAEGAVGASVLCDAIAKRTGLSVRATVLGHIQRGGTPTMSDRILGARFGVRAAELLKEDCGARLIGIKCNQIIDADIDEGLAAKPRDNARLLQISKILGM
jgi:6-phosphofructokinase 1